MNKVLESTVDQYISQLTKYNNYYNDFLNEIKLKIRSQARSDDLYIMATEEVQLNFMEFLIRLKGAKKIIEVGVFRGISTLGFALSMPDDGKLYALDISDKFLKGYQHYWDDAGVAHKINLKIDSAQKSLQSLIVSEPESFDFIYVDADKLSYDIYYEQSYKLLKQGGLVLLDNMLQAGGVVNPKSKSEVAINQLNNKIKNDPRVASSFLKFDDGLQIVQKL